MDYTLADTRPPTNEQVRAVRERFRGFGLEVR
jgi:hypothetical protein